MERGPVNQTLVEGTPLYVDPSSPLWADSCRTPLSVCKSTAGHRAQAQLIVLGPLKV